MASSMPRMLVEGSHESGLLVLVGKSVEKVSATVFSTTWLIDIGVGQFMDGRPLENSWC